MSAYHESASSARTSAATPTTRPSGTGRTAVVVGGGLAGTRAALELADRGWDTTLLESRSRLGGAAYSFDRDGLTVDTGQHVLLRCYTEYRSLLRRMGVDALVPVQDRMDIPVLRPGRPVQRLRRARGLPAPLHLLPAIAGYRVLTPGERVRAAGAVRALRRLDPEDRRLDEETFGAWLRRHGQSGRAIERLWGLVTVAALNIDVDEASLALAAQVFRTGLLDRADAGDLAVPAAPLSALHDDAARRALGQAGVRCVTGRRVREIRRDGDTFQVCTASGSLASDAVVVAVPHRQAARLVPEEAAPHRDRWAGLGSRAIVNVHVRYDRRVTALRFAAALDSPVQWVFDRTAEGSSGQHLVVSLSDADADARLPAEQLVGTHQEALARLFPAAREARVLDSFVTREPRATFAQRAGSRALRPPAASRVPGLALAGAWTDTGWPDTLEGAVRSGLAAAQVIGTPYAGARRRQPEVPRTEESRGRRVGGHREVSRT